MAAVESNRGAVGGVLRDWPLPTRGQGQRLASLVASELSDRFYNWRGASGQSYICSIFAMDEIAIVAGFSSAVVIGVFNDGATRRPVSVMSSSLYGAAQCQAFQARKGGVIVNEWHVHFSSDDSCARDLALSLLH